MMKFIHLVLVFLLSLPLLAPPLAAQQGGVQLLLSKARSLEARGRMDLAAQNWKQILLANPNQSEALAGLARYAKQNGNADEERAYLDRLRKIDPRNPDIAAVEKMRVLTQPERDRLDEAGRLTMRAKPDEAMKIYDEVFGGEPPPAGKWAEPYYEAEAATAGRRAKAIAQLRRLCERERTNEVYRLWLARVLVYDPKTRMEGFQLLESIHDPGTAESARTAWRQALLWERENPAALESVNRYLERYPDPQLYKVQQSLTQERERQAQEASKKRGFQALEKQDMSAAGRQFAEVLRRSPNDLNAVAGMAFVRLHQKRFDEAATLFDRARDLSPKRADVREGFETAK
ncbi:MAG: tetratricopeptide repeat protein, partial [Acidobacteria bacterium]|nr:tetratricopeptide repeat protein [Acidobacteriota bacterium]